MTISAKDLAKTKITKILDTNKTLVEWGNNRMTKKELRAEIDKILTEMNNSMKDKLSHRIDYLEKEVGKYRLLKELLK